MSGSVLVWLGIGILVLVFVVEFFERRPALTYNFLDFVKHPWLWNKVAANRRAYEQLVESAQLWGDEELEQTVYLYLFDDEESPSARQITRVILQALESKPHAAVLKAMADPQFREQLVQLSTDQFLPSAPFIDACTLLGDTPPKAAIDVLADFLDESSHWIRGNAALALAKIGSVDVMPWLRKALADPHNSVRNRVLSGLRWADTTKTLDDELRREMFAEIHTLLAKLNSGEQGSGFATIERDGARTLLILDRQRACEVLLAEEFLGASSNILYANATALAEANARIAPERLRKLIAQLESAEPTMQTLGKLGKVLLLLGIQQDPQDRPLLEARMNHENERVSKQAAKGLLASYGLAGFEQQLWKIEEEQGRDALTPPQQQLSAAILFNNEVLNGGLLQYFANSSGDRWPEANDGLETLGLTDAAAILREAAAKFGKQGPSLNQSRRQKQLARLARRDEQLFRPLVQRYLQSCEQYNPAVTRFVVQHAAAFRPGEDRTD